jgi:hypothetical protein
MKKTRNAFRDVQKKYGLTDPAMIQKRIIFVNLMALLRQVIEPTARNKKLLSAYNTDWLATEKAMVNRTP